MRALCKQRKKEKERRRREEEPEAAHGLWCELARASGAANRLSTNRPRAGPRQVWHAHRESSPCVRDRSQSKNREEQANDIKLLLLGSASAGKSTFAKQLKILFMGGFSAHELTMFKEQVSYCIWRNMRILAGRPEVKV